MIDNTPKRLHPQSQNIPAILKLIRREFAYMEERIDPPSSMHRMTEASISKHCRSNEVWYIGEKPRACVFLTVKEEVLYLGKLAVSSEYRSRGYAHTLLQLAEDRAREKGFNALELESRIELVEIHSTFEHLGFDKVGEASHPGFDWPTYIIMRKAI